MNDDHGIVRVVLANGYASHVESVCRTRKEWFQGLYSILSTTQDACVMLDIILSDESVEGSWNILLGVEVICKSLHSSSDVGDVGLWACGRRTLKRGVILLDGNVRQSGCGRQNKAGKVEQIHC